MQIRFPLYLYRTCFQIIIALFFFFTNSYGLSNKSRQYEIDSVKTLIQHCPTDTCRFDILSKMTWKYINVDINKASFYAEWAFSEIKNTTNLNALASAYSLKANVFQREAYYDSSSLFFRKALDIFQKTNNYNLAAWCNYGFAESSYKSGDPATALQYFINARYLFSKINNTYGITASTWFLADTYDLLNNADSASLYFNKTVENFKNSTDTKNKILLCLEMAMFYKKQNNIEKTLEQLSLAENLADGIINDVEAGEVYSKIGDFFVNTKNNNSLACDYYKKALKRTGNRNNAELKAIIYNKLGDIYLKKGYDSLALTYNYLSLDIAKKMQLNDLICKVNKSLGHVFKNTGNHIITIYYFKASLGNDSHSLPKISSHESMIEIADLYLKLSNQKEAFIYYKKALDWAEIYHLKKEIAISNFKIGNFYNDKKQYQLAEKYYLSSQRDALTAKDISSIQNVAFALSRFYFLRNKFKPAYTYQYLAHTMEDSLLRKNAQTNKVDIEIEYEFEKIKKGNEVQQALNIKEIEKQKILRNFLMLISLSLGILGIIFFSSYRRKKKDNQLLSMQKDEISDKNYEIEAQIEEITNQRDEIEAQKEEMERISEKLHESDQMKLRFFSNISHEIRTPLTLIINPLQNLINSFNSSPELIKQLKLIYNNASRLNELTNQILDLQKLDSGNLLLNNIKADIVEFFKGIVSSFEGFADKTNCTLSFSSTISSAYCFFDKDKISKIISNLLSNAFKYSNEGGEIDVELQFENNLLIICVSDKGRGIPTENINDVFKRYYQLESSNNQYEGTGIGLAYVKELVELMKGTVKMQSEINKGTCVELQIPVNECIVKDSKACTLEIKPKKELTGKKQNFDIQNIDSDNNDTSILIVEDNDDLRTFIGNIFKNEYEIIYAKDGAEGIKNAYKHLPDLIISDIMMPNTNGIELCEKLKNDIQTSHIPIIFLTAKDNFDSHVDGYESGADDYIVKPFDTNLLKLKVKNIIATRDAMRKQFDIKTMLSNHSIKVCDTDKEFLKKCIVFIEKHIDDSQFSVDVLAKELGFSNRNLYRKIKALTNQTPAELIREYRLHYAYRLLQNSTLKVFEVASSIGYENVNKFREAYKKKFDILPSESNSQVLN